MAAGAGDHLMLSRLGLGEDNAEKAGSSTLLLHESVVRPLLHVRHTKLSQLAGIPYRETASHAGECCHLFGQRAAGHGSRQGSLALGRKRVLHEADAQPRGRGTMPYACSLHCHSATRPAPANRSGRVAADARRSAAAVGIYHDRRSTLSSSTRMARYLPRVGMIAR